MHRAARATRGCGDFGLPACRDPNQTPRSQHLSAWQQNCLAGNHGCLLDNLLWYLCPTLSTYPWPGDQPDPNRANYDATGINSTNAVGAFPGGVSPYGVEEMAGTVWEWCSTQWLDNYADYEQKVDDTLSADKVRVLRGGSVDLEDYVRCAARSRSNPYDEVNNVGFRVVLSPFPLGSGPLASEPSVLFHSDQSGAKRRHYNR